MPQVSGELRWFIAAKNTSEIEEFQRWFSAGDISVGGGKKPRTDVYVVDPSTVELGIKDRQGRPGIEVKTLVDGNAGEFRLGGRAATFQIWTKVSSRVLMLPNDSTQKLITRKTRLLRKFEAADSEAREVALGSREFGEDVRGPAAAPDIACNVEWTAVELPDSSVKWWTFGLEAFAMNTRGDVRSILQKTLKQTVLALEARSPSMPTLKDTFRELSYPAWLKEVCSESKK